RPRSVKREPILKLLSDQRHPIVDHRLLKIRARSQPARFHRWVFRQDSPELPGVKPHTGAGRALVNRHGSLRAEEVPHQQAVRTFRAPTPWVDVDLDLRSPGERCESEAGRLVRISEPSQFPRTKPDPGTTL